jgi:hypothetical protein
MDKYHVTMFIQQTTNMASSDRFVAVGEEEIVEKGQQQNY